MNLNCSRETERDYVCRDRECVDRWRERERERLVERHRKGALLGKLRVCVKIVRECVCKEIESVCRERGRECRERERWKVCVERWRQGICVLR